jgi:hypothetical protein
MNTTTLKATTANMTNVSSYGADVLHYAGLKGEQDSGPLFFVLAYSDRLHSLKDKIAYAVSKEDKIRPVVLDDWKATPEGEDLIKEYASLLAIKQPTAEQKVRQKTLLDLQNQVYIQAVRNVETCVGIDKLKELGRSVTIQRIQGTTKYACYVISNAKNEDGNAVEIFHVPFTATQLRKLGKIATIDATIPTTDIRKECDSLKQGAANNDKGGIEGLSSGEIGKTAKALDAAIAGRFKDGQLEGMSAATRNEVYMLWAQLDASMSNAEKAKARAEYNALAAKSDVAPVVAVKTTDNSKAKAKAKVA